MANKPLPKQEANQFQKALRYYDARKYTECVDECDKILAKFPGHAEVTAAKAQCIQGYQHFQRDLAGGKKGLKKKQLEEAASKKKDDAAWKTEDPFALCKKAIEADFKCVLAWHAMGNMHRHDSNPSEALKCYKRGFQVDCIKVDAVKAGNGALEGSTALNNNLTRDATAMAIQERDWAFLVEMRQRMLGDKSGVRVNWLTYCVAHLFAGNVELASAIADTVCKVLDAGDTAQEINELLLFRAELKLELRDAKAAIAILTKEKPEVSDRPEKLKLLARAYLMNQKRADARKCLEELLAMRESERDVLFQLAQAENIHQGVEPIVDTEGGGLPRAVKPSPAFCALLDDVRAKFPRCDAAARLALDYQDASTADGAAAFEQRLVKYTAPWVRKLVPSLVTVLESLYVSPEKIAIIEKTFLAWNAALGKKDQSAFVPEGEETPFNPALQLAVYEFLASHFCRKGEFATAHEWIDKAIAHTPTHEVLYLSKARIFNAQGGPEFAQQAAELADKAQLLDLQDKYLNNNSAIYFLRAGDVATAEARLALFFKPSPVKIAHLEESELQYTWFERELGKCHLRKGDFVSALQALLLVEKHQSTNHSELFDFHNYTLRRNNCRQFVDVIRTEDAFASTTHFLAACPSIVEAYLGIDAAGQDATAAAHHPREPIVHPDGPNSDEQKRIDRLQEDFTLDIDTTAPLDKALKYVRALQQHRRNAISTHTLAFEVHLRAGRALQAASAVSHVCRIIRDGRGGGGGGGACVGAGAGGAEAQKQQLVAKFREHLGKAPVADARVKALIEKAMEKW